jgi:prolyl 4-hydroxylase
MNVKSVTVSVTDDMGHLSWSPIGLPSYILDHINNDVDVEFTTINGYGFRQHYLKAGVPQTRVIDNYVITYFLTYKTTSPIKVTVVPGTHYLKVLDNLFTKNECNNFIMKANNIVTEGKNKAWHYPDTGGNYMRVIMVDRALAINIWDRLKLANCLPDKYGSWKLLYINDYFRFSRYRTGGKFPIHTDGQNYDVGRPDITNEATISLFTLNIFLNDDFDGGETDFFEPALSNAKLRYSVKPKAGKAALFWYNQLHRGNEVKSIDSFKYLLRTDVMGVHV